MKLFGINFSSNSDFRITENDKLWVDENFRWLKEVFGYPNKHYEQILLTEKFFPATFKSQKVTVDNACDDLCKLLGIPRSYVHAVMIANMDGKHQIPYQVQGKAFECETDLKKGDHSIYVANSLLQYPDRLLYCLIYEFIRIRLTESEVEFDAGGDDTGLFIYLAGIYYGFGVLLAQNLLHADRRSAGEWEIKWNHGAEMPQQVMAYSLATYANLCGEDEPAWSDQFKGSFKGMLEGALQYLSTHPNGLYKANEVTAADLFDRACEQFDKNESEDAIATLQKILFITEDDHMKADVYNNMGYYYMMRDDYPQGISNFRKALTFGSAYGYANDNLGYSLILSGELEEGLTYVQKAMETGNNDIAYSFRNLALYHQLKREYTKAEEFYQKSFEQNTQVDLLEFHYGEFLETLGRVEEAKIYFEKSAAKNEEKGKREIGITW